MRRRFRDGVYQPIQVKVINSLSIPTEVIDKLFENVRYDPNGKGCWVRGNDSTLYTTVSINGKAKRAHRVSFELFNGRPLVYLGCHSCDTPACINPDHILDRSSQWNYKDAVDKSRLGNAFLGRSSNCKVKLSTTNPEPFGFRTRF